MYEDLRQLLLQTYLGIVNSSSSKKINVRFSIHTLRVNLQQSRAVNNDFHCTMLSAIIVNQISYFSPGIVCPSSWTTAGVATKDSAGSLTLSGVFTSASAALFNGDYVDQYPPAFPWKPWPPTRRRCSVVRPGGMQIGRNASRGCQASESFRRVVSSSFLTRTTHSSRQLSHSPAPRQLPA